MRDRLALVRQLAARGPAATGAATAGAASTAFASVVPFASSFEVESGWVRLQPSR